jgi:hypothetical protein
MDQIGTSKARRWATTSALHALGQLPPLALFQEASAVFIGEICADRVSVINF